MLPLDPDPLIDIEIGKVQCGRNTVATAEIDFDTSGDLGGDTIQPQTENAFRMTYNSAVDRPAVSLVGRVPDDGDVTVDTAPGPAGRVHAVARRHGHPERAGGGLPRRRGHRGRYRSPG